MSQAVVHELRVAQCSVGLISFLFLSHQWLRRLTGNPCRLLSSWNYHCGSACPLNMIHPLKLASPLILPPVCGLQRWTVGVSTRPQLKVSISTFWLSVLYLVKILLFCLVPRKQLVKLLFLSICLAHLGWLCTPDYFPIWQESHKAPEAGKTPWKFL